MDKKSDNYRTEKNKCPNRVVRVLLHGTQVDPIINILSTNFRKAKIHIFGKGVYFTDILDYAWYYGGIDNRDNFEKIPKVNEFFTCVASEIMIKIN